MYMFACDSSLGACMCVFACDCACVSKHTLTKLARSISCILNFMSIFFNLSAHSQVISKIYLSSSMSVDPPKVTQHPKSLSVLTGVQATFKVEATGDDLTFQWLKDGSDVHNDSNYSGTDTSTLMIQRVKKSDGGCYSCLVSNEAKIEGEVSDKAQLTICE